MHLNPGYPSLAHEQAASAIVEFFTGRDGVDAILLVNSCARGKASRDSCLDIVVLTPESSPGTAALAEAWERYYETDGVFEALRRAGKFSVVHLDFVDGRFQPGQLDEDLDWFEVEIGNYLVYAFPLWQRNDHWERLRAEWLPYYDEDLRRERLLAVRHYCLHHLDHIPLYVERELYFQSFDRLYNAFRGFLQGLFIARRTYPIAYNKWIREQVVDILGLPELYERLPRLFEIQRFESTELVDKARELRDLVDYYLVE